MRGGKTYAQATRGFTIVELLIVIIVMAILAAITIVAYTGIQQSTRNTAKAGTVEQITKLIRLYQAENDEYPRNGGGTWCATVDNACTGYSGTVSATDNTNLMNDLKRYGTPPATSGDKVESGSRYGVQYLYDASRTLSSQSNPVLLLFWLEGTNQMCAGTVGGMVSVADSGAAGNFEPANRSSGNSGGKTRCYLMFPN